MYILGYCIIMFLLVGIILPFAEKINIGDNNDETIGYIVVGSIFWPITAVILAGCFVGIYIKKKLKEKLK